MNGTAHGAFYFFFFNLKKKNPNFIRFHENNSILIGQKFGLTQDDVELHMTLFAFERVLHDDWLNQVATNAVFNSTNSRHWTCNRR